jgi:hypothetical protein
MKIRPEAAARFGLNPGTVFQAISTLVKGRKVGKIYQKQKIFDVAVWGQPAERGRDLGSVAHNSTMLVSHCQHPEQEEGMPALYQAFGRKAGAEPAAAGTHRKASSENPIGLIAGCGDRCRRRCFAQPRHLHVAAPYATCSATSSIRSFTRSISHMGVLVAPQIPTDSVS